jgi:hypothetical protein
MTEQTLDRVARALATGMPRRAVMKAAAAAAVGGAITMVVRHEDALAGYCVKGSAASQRCGNGCINPDTHRCCNCKGGPQRLELQYTCSEIGCH